VGQTARTFDGDRRWWDAHWGSGWQIPRRLPRESVTIKKRSARKSRRLEKDIRGYLPIEWHDEEGGNIADRLPKIYREWASVFSKVEINRLPDHTEYDHRIEVVEGTVPPFEPIYPLSEKELQPFREYLCAEAWRESVALRRLSRLNGYSCIRIAEGDEWKTAFSMRYGSLEHLGCHPSSEGIAMSPAKIQSIENIAGKDSANRGLGWAEKCRERSAVLGLRELRWPVKIQSIENRIELRSTENVLQFLGSAGKRQEHSLP
jgi:hypothetical protein